MIASLLPAAFISFRFLPLFVVAPIASFQRVPLVVRIVLSIALAIILSGLIENAYLFQPEIIIAIFFTEFLIGMSLAFGFHAASAAVHTMGQLVDLQMGFSAASVFDPSSEEVASPTGELLSIMLIVVLFSANVHHDVLIGFARLIEVLPPGAPLQWQSNWLTILGLLYTTGFIILSPVLFTLWFIDFTMAFISRSLPQVPVYFIGLPVKVAIGILLLSWFFGQATGPLFRLLQEALVSWGLMFRV